jgi:lysozyme
MNVEQLRLDLERDEGCVYAVYLDHLGYPTFGIGHLVTEEDPEHGQPVGTEVSEDRVREAFNSDIECVIGDCDRAFDDFGSLPEGVQLVIANMIFNLGLPRFNKFTKMIRAINCGDWQSAADEMIDSRWYQQVTARARRLEGVMRGIV